MPNPRSKEQVEPRQQFFACYDAQKLEGSADEKKIRTALKAIGINYDKLTEDERKLIKKIPVSYTHLDS